MAIELIFEAFSKKHTYRLNDAVTNINTGTLNQITNTFMYIAKIGAYIVVFEYLAIAHLPRTWATFVLAYILKDFFYYWAHRMSHEINLFWGGHVVHHQSEDFNLSVALRQSSTSIIWSFPFYLPMAIIGIDPMQFALVSGLNLIYQFWIHTEHIDKMGPLEYIFNTPSHHRVHHGRDPKYLDKNYAGTFIIWDRMFGTFQAEEERPNYGITTPLNSWNPIYANFAHYIDLYGWLKQVRNIPDAFRLLFKGPGWFPEYMGGAKIPAEVSKDYVKYNAHRTLNIQLYIMLQFFASLIITALYLFNYKAVKEMGDLGMIIKLSYSAWIVVSTLNIGVMFESKYWAIWVMEIIRLVAVPLCAAFYIMEGLSFPYWVVWIGAGYAGLSILHFLLVWQNRGTKLHSTIQEVG